MMNTESQSERRKVEDPLRPQPRNLSHRASVVLTVAEPFLGKGRNITMDNSFSDIKLRANLKQRKTTLFGTVQRNKRFLRPKFSTKRGKKCMSQHLGSQRIACWSVIKAIATKMWWYVLSSMHNEPLSNQEGKNCGCPILQPNKGRSGYNGQTSPDLYNKDGYQKVAPCQVFNIVDLNTVAALVILQMNSPGDKLAKHDEGDNFIWNIAFNLMRDRLIRRQESLVKVSCPLNILMGDCLRSMGVPPAPVQAAAAD